MGFALDGELKDDRFWRFAAYLCLPCDRLPELVEDWQLFIGDGKDKRVAASAVAVHHGVGPPHDVAAVFQTVRFGNSIQYVIKKARIFFAAGLTIFGKQFFLFPDAGKKLHETSQIPIERVNVLRGVPLHRIVPENLAVALLGRARATDVIFLLILLTCEPLRSAKHSTILMRITDLKVYVKRAKRKGPGIFQALLSRRERITTPVATRQAR